MLLLVIAVALLIIAVGLLPQALAAFSAAGPWLWVPARLVLARSRWREEQSPQTKLGIL
jgi:hypothetical protein